MGEEGQKQFVYYVDQYCNNCLNHGTHDKYYAFKLTLPEAEALTHLDKQLEKVSIKLDIARRKSFGPDPPELLHEFHKILHERGRIRKGHHWIFFSAPHGTYNTGDIVDPSKVRVFSEDPKMRW